MISKALWFVSGRLNIFAEIIALIVFIALMVLRQISSLQIRHGNTVSTVSTAQGDLR